MCVDHRCTAPWLRRAHPVHRRVVAGRRRSGTDGRERRRWTGSGRLNALPSV